MSSSRTSYKKTGKNVTVKKQDLINLVNEKIIQYENAKASGKKLIMANPYTEPIYTKVEGGKMIQIPLETQSEAVRNMVRKLKESHKRLVSQPTHTRLERRTRYEGFDPFILDKQLREETLTNEVDPELMKLRDSENRRNNINMPDLPQEYTRFEETEQEYVGDRIDMSQNYPNHPKNDQIIPDDTNDMEYPYDTNELEYQQDEYNSRRRYINSSAKPIQSFVDGVESDISTETYNIETVGIEKFAPINTEENDVKDTYIGQTNQSNQNEATDNGEYYDANCEPCREMKYTDDNKMSYDVDVEGNEDDQIEQFDSDEFISDSTYKYLFFILLLVVAYLAYNYKNQQSII